MTDNVHGTATPKRWLAVAGRIPVTIILFCALVGVGVATAALWRPFEQTDLFQTIGYGVPAFAEGRWWTILSGMFVSGTPWMYIPVLLSLIGVGYLEYRKGALPVLAYFFGGQIIAVLVAALILWLGAMIPDWHWAAYEASVLDVGPSGGTLACVAAAIGLLKSPWRSRLWLVLVTALTIPLMFFGTIADLEHFIAVLLVLVVDRSIRIRMVSLREQRLIGFLATVALVTVDFAFTLWPSSGPFGDTQPMATSVIGSVLNLIVMALVLRGLAGGRRWAWVLTVLLALANVWYGAAAGIAIGFVSRAQLARALGEDPLFSMGYSVLWLMLLVYLIAVRRAYAAGRGRKLLAKESLDHRDVATVVMHYGGGTLSWQATWPRNEYVRTDDGLMAYQSYAGVAIGLADPIGSKQGRAQTIKAFIDSTENAALVPCIFSASDETRKSVPTSWRSLIVAEDTIVDLPGLEFKGKKWGDVRTAINRARREDVRFEITRWAQLSWGQQAQLEAISASWVEGKELPEMGFTLGSLKEAHDEHVKIALAVASNGDIEGFLSWMPIYAAGGIIKGWTLDLMRRRKGGFPTVMEFLIGSSAMAFKQTGAELISLSGAPLAYQYPPDAGLVADLAERLSKALEPVYGFGSLHKFKQKFNPRYQEMYLLYRDESDLGKILAGLAKAYLPDATVGQFAKASVDLMRNSK